jgi:hypothetical protein
VSRMCDWMIQEEERFAKEVTLSLRVRYVNNREEEHIYQIANTRPSAVADMEDQIIKGMAHVLKRFTGDPPE